MLRLSVAAITGLELLAVIAAAVWVPLVLAGSLYIYRQRIVRINSFEATRNVEYRAREQQHEIREIAERLESFLPAVTERLPMQVAQYVTDGLHSELRAMRQAVGELEQAQLDSQPPTKPELATDLALVREISHALHTPLSQIEAAALSTERRLAGSRSTPDLADSLSQITVSITICKAFLSSFRLLASGTTASEQDTSIELATAVRRAATIYVSRADRAIALDIGRLSAVKGYDNSYVLAALVPLIENAVESSPDDGTISITQEFDGTRTTFRISNSFDDDFEPQLYDSGHTTKPGHDGLGLSTVRRLLDGAAGSLTHEHNGGTIVFIATLPAKAS